MQPKSSSCGARVRGFPYDGKRVWAAVQQVDKNRSGILVEEQRQALDEEARKETRIGKQEAIDIMKYLVFRSGSKAFRALRAATWRRIGSNSTRPMRSSSRSTD